MNTHRTSKTALALALCGACCMGASAKNLTLGIDLSGSNPLMRHENFAFMASQYVTEAIGALKNGDVVTIKTFGGRDDVGNLLSARYTITRRMKPQTIAAAVTEFMQSLPKKADGGQSSTNLLAWMEFTSGFGCDEGSHIVVVTDAVESSTVVGGQQFVEGQQGLPEPDVDLTGCAVTFWGLGAGLPYESVKFVHREWARLGGRQRRVVQRGDAVTVVSLIAATATQYRSSVVGEHSGRGSRGQVGRFVGVLCEAKEVMTVERQ